jgi:hypothetical protein
MTTQPQVIIFMALATGPSLVRILDPPYSSLHYVTAKVSCRHRRHHHHRHNHHHRHGPQ